MQRDLEPHAHGDQKQTTQCDDPQPQRERLLRPRTSQHQLHPTSRALTNRGGRFSTVPGVGMRATELLNVERFGSGLFASAKVKVPLGETCGERTLARDAMTC